MDNRNEYCEFFLKASPFYVLGSKRGIPLEDMEDAIGEGILRTLEYQGKVDSVNFVNSAIKNKVIDRERYKQKRKFIHCELEEQLFEQVNSKLVYEAMLQCLKEVLDKKELNYFFQYLNGVPAREIFPNVSANAAKIRMWRIKQKIQKSKFSEFL